MLRDLNTYLSAAILAAFAVLLIMVPAGTAADHNSSSLQDAIPTTVSRLVSLAPSNTELIYSIGAQRKLVAVSTYCDYPPEARRKEKAGSFVSANLERLARLKPDLIVLVNGQESLAGILKHQGFPVLVLGNNRLSQIATNLRTLGRLTGTSARADELASACERSLARLSAVVNRAPSRPQVFYCVWPQPLLTAGAGSFLNDVITTCGGTNIAAATKTAYPHYSVERLLIAQPDVVIMPYEAGGQTFLQRPPWSFLTAKKKGRLYFLPEPATDYLARPTLRVFAGLYWLAARIHPELAGELDVWIKGAPQPLRKSSRTSSAVNMKKIFDDVPPASM